MKPLPLTELGQEQDEKDGAQPYHYGGLYPKVEHEPWHETNQVKGHSLYA
jgi:hypothetical protein